MSPAIDFYDDHDGATLRAVFPSLELLPQFVKEATFVPEAELPDSDFALVLVDGGQKMQKFATADPGNTFLSVVYYMANHDMLTKEASKVAASRLLTACERFDLQPPALLSKHAEGLVAKSVKDMHSKFTTPGRVMDKLDPKGPAIADENQAKAILDRVETGGKEVHPNFKEVAAPEPDKEHPTEKMGFDLLELITVMQIMGVEPELASGVLAKLKQGMQPDQQEMQALSQVALKLQQNPTMLQQAQANPNKAMQAQRELGIQQEGQRAMAQRTQERMPEQGMLQQRLSKLSSANSLLGSLAKTANVDKVDAYVDQGMALPDAVKKAYPDYSDEQVASFVEQHGSDKTGSFDYADHLSSDNWNELYQSPSVLAAAKKHGALDGSEVATGFEQHPAVVAAVQAEADKQHGHLKTAGTDWSQFNEFKHPSGHHILLHKSISKDSLTGPEDVRSHVDKGNAFVIKSASPYVQYGFDDRPRVKRSEGVFNLLSGRYPADTYSQVEKAASYFDKNWTQFHPRERREYCHNLVKQAGKLGVSHAVTDTVVKYAGSGLGPAFGMYMDSRRTVVPEELIPYHDYVKEAAPEIGADAVADILEEMDKTAGLTSHWGGAVPDPWHTVFAMTKAAEWSERVQDGMVVTEDHLNEMVLNDLDALKSQFDHHFVREFAKNPVAVFKSLPDPVKNVIGRLATDNT